MSNPNPKPKRSADQAFKDVSKMSSPYLSMFESFRGELDEHHDRRERVVKASRDITASSKKIIFSLQRTRKVKVAISPYISKSNQQYYETIESQYKSIASDIQDINAFRYMRSVSPGNQEFMEALLFQHYLENQQLMPYEEARSRVASLGNGNHLIFLPVEDYILGLFDMIGELMRFSITTMAMTGELPSGESKETDDKSSRNVLSDLRELRTLLESLDMPQSSRLGQEVQKKMDTMQTCVEKVENASYGLIVRGAERPKGWIPPDMINDTEKKSNVDMT